MDLPEAYEKWISFKEHLESHDIHPFCISAMNRWGTHDVVSAAYGLLQKEMEKKKKDVQERTGTANLNHVANSIQKQRSASMNDFEVFHDSSSNTWHVVGAGIQRFVQMTNWQWRWFGTIQMDNSHRAQGSRHRILLNGHNLDREHHSTEYRGKLV